MWTLSPIHTGRLKASVFEVDPKVLSRNAPESIGESKHFTIASSLRGEVTATRKIGPLGISNRVDARIEMPSGPILRVAVTSPESIGESKHFTIASSLRGEVTATRKIGPLGISIRASTRSVLDGR